MSTTDPVPSKFKLFLKEAFTKVTTYIALGISGLSQLSDHAEELKTAFPTLRAFLPPSGALDHASHYAISALGVLIVYTRVRRLLKPST